MIRQKISEVPSKRAKVLGASGAEQRVDRQYAVELARDQWSLMVIFPSAHWFLQNTDGLGALG
jgi:hypothetical protein